MAKKSQSSVHYMRSRFSHNFTQSTIDSYFDRIQAKERTNLVMYTNQMTYLSLLNGRRYMYEEYMGAVAYIWTWCT